MQLIAATFRLLRMLFTFAQCTLTILVFMLNGLVFLCKLACVGFPWIFVASIALLLILSRYFKLRKASPDLTNDMLGEELDGVCKESAWPIANRGASLDALENSATAIKKCADQKCTRLLLDLQQTKCGELVIFHNSMLDRIGSKTNERMATKQISAMTMEDIQKLDITENHPLGEKYAPEKILTINELIQLLNSNPEMKVFLLIAPRTKTVVDKFIALLRGPLEENKLYKRIIFLSRSPYVIYQLRKSTYFVVGGLWIDKMSKTNLPKFLRNSQLFISAFGAFYRNIVAYVLGISVVFLHKNEYNAHLGNLWRNVDIRPIVYTINSPNEKRYFQTVLKTQYLTDSLRSEPHHFIKVRK